MRPGARQRRSRRRLWWGLTVGLLVLVLAGAGAIALVRPAALFGTAAAPTSAPPSTPAVQPSPVLAAAGTSAAMPSPAAVAAALRTPLRDNRLGTHVGVEVVDVTSGTELYGQGQSDPMTPASTMKLATSLAALATRGPAYQIPTRVVAGTNPGDVVIVGGGDPTLALGATSTYPGAAHLSDLVAQVKQALRGFAPTRIVIDTSLFSGPATSPNWDPADVTAGQTAKITPLMSDGGRVNPAQFAAPAARYAQPDLAVGQAFAKSLGLPASAVARGTAPPGSAASAVSPGPTGPAVSASPDGSASPAGPPAAGTLLGLVKSPPLVSIVEQLLSISDNTVAEMVARQVALARGQPASFTGAEEAVRQTLVELGVQAAGGQLVDGSGLSAADLLTPKLLTDVLLTATKADRPQLHGLFTGLPVAGYSGTLADRFHSPAANPGDGVVRAKTGTLTGVNTLAGYVVDASGRLLAFAVMADKVAVGPDAAEAALDRVATALATLT